MFKRILLALIAVIALFLGIIAVQPSDFTVTRSATIYAPAEKVFPHVNDFHEWQAWSPWVKLDPSSKLTFEGSPQGKDAVYTWSGNDLVGEGRMTITESQPMERILIDLQFIKPYPGKCETSFSFKPVGRNTVVTWSMTGHNSFMGKAFGLFLNMDQLIGSEFEKGLASMKEIIESPSKESPSHEPKEKASAHEEPARKESLSSPRRRMTQLRRK